MPVEVLPKNAARMWEKVYESARGRGYSESRAAMQAWGAVKRCYYKTADGLWKRRKKCVRRTPVVSRGRVVR